jgi:hypothetical protein
MTSLAYQIYRKGSNDDDEEDVRSAAELPRPGISYPVPDRIHFKKSQRGHKLYSSFHKKSVVLPPNSNAEKLQRQCSIGTPPPQPPKLRALIQESGIWQEIVNQTGESMQSILEERGDESALNKLGHETQVAVKSTLQSTLSEILAMDEQETFPCTCTTHSSASPSSCKCHTFPGSATMNPKISISFYSSSDETNSMDWLSSEGTVSTVSTPSLIDHKPLHAPASSEPETESSQQLPTLITPSTKSAQGTIDMEKCSPDIVFEESQPSRSMLLPRPLDKPPSRVPSFPVAPMARPSSRFIPYLASIPRELPRTPMQKTHRRRAESDDIRNSGYIQDLSAEELQDLVRKQSYQSMVSEITFESLSAKSSGRSILTTPPTTPMVLDPRAPQFQMALQQQQQPDRTVRTRNFSALIPGPPVLTSSPSPQVMRKSSTEEEELPKVGYESGRPFMPAIRPYSRKGTLPLPNSVSGQQAPDGEHNLVPSYELQYSDDDEEEASLQSGLVGPFASPGRVRVSHHSMLPSDSPLEDSNPQLYPGNLDTVPETQNDSDADNLEQTSDHIEEESLDSASDSMPTSLRGPFGSPSLGDVSRPNLRDLLSPQQHSNPLLYPANLQSDDEDDELQGSGSISIDALQDLGYPEGVTYMPPSPLEKNVKRIPHPGNLDAVPEAESDSDADYLEQTSDHMEEESLGSVPAPMPTSLRGPFASPSLRDVSRPNLRDLLSPQKDSNPLLYPANLLSDDEDDELHDSGSLDISQELGYPEGVTYVPPSPLEKNVMKLPSKVDPDSSRDICFDINKKSISKQKTAQFKNYADIVLDQGLGPLTASSSTLHTGNLDIMFDASERSSFQDSDRDIVFDAALGKVESESSGPKEVNEPEKPLPLPTKIQSRVITQSGVEEQFWAKGSVDGLRVKLCPAQIGYRIGGETHVHPGYYSGPLNRGFQMHGYGMFWFTSGDLYLGGFSNGELDGVGTMSITTGEDKQVFTGYFHRNEFVGEELIEK